MLNWIKFFVLTSTFLFVSFGFGQSIWTNPITGTNPNTDNPYTTGDVSDVNISVSGIGRGTGINGTNANDRYNANGWNTASIDLTKYFEWTVTPDVGCEINFSSFVYTSQASGTGPTSFAFRSSVDGFAANIGAPTATGTTLNLSNPAYQNISTPITFRLYGWGASGAGGTFSINNFTFNGAVTCGSANTISISALSSTVFNVDCSTEDNGVIGFTTTGLFDAGNVFTVELSDASGNFSSPLTIGTLSDAYAEGVDLSGTIGFSIPAALPSGSGYRIRLTSSDPTTISGDNGSDLNITLSGTCTPPHITSLIINACNAICSEGDNEMFFGNTGDYSMEFTATNTNVFYGSNPSPTNNFTTSIHDLPAVTDDFNLNAGCPGLFVDAYNTVVPPNSTFMLVHTDVCPLDVIDFVNLCGQGPIYIAYVDAPSWSSGGNFSNSTSCSGGFRYLRSLFTTTFSTTHEIDFYYECALNTGTTGDFATWNEDGGAALVQDNEGCAFPLTVLPIELITFQARNDHRVNSINWSTASELNNDFFNLYYSRDGFSFQFLDKVEGQGTSSMKSIYEVVHRNVESGVYYYNLESVDFDGTVHNKGIVTVVVELNNMYFEPMSNTVFFQQISDYEVYTVEGKLINSFTESNKFSLAHSGMFLIQDTKKGTSYKLVVP